MQRQTYAAFMGRAYAMELEAAERYAELAEQMQAHNNSEVADLFRRLAGLEERHAKRILEAMRWPSLPALAPPYAAEAGEGPETAPLDAAHYLMRPWHALALALDCEERAAAWFEDVAGGRGPKKVREAAAELAGEEREHARLIRAWMERVPRPEAQWSHDPDPPRAAG